MDTAVKLTSKEGYEAASEAWHRAKGRMDAANFEARAAETALYEAEALLAEHEAAPGIPAYFHAPVPAEQCRIGSRCKVHNPPANGGEW